jgi:hypothetical protein
LTDLRDRSFSDSHDRALEQAFFRQLDHPGASILGREDPAGAAEAVRKDEFVDYFAACVSTAMDGEGVIGGVVAQLVAEVHNEVCDEWRAKVEKLTARIAELEQTANLAARFNDLERALDLRRQARAAVKRVSAPIAGRAARPEHKVVLVRTVATASA